MKRREFIQSSIALTTAASIGAPALSEAAEPDKAHIQRYRALGKTGINMSDISFGAGRLPSASLILRAIDRGFGHGGLQLYEISACS